MLDYESAGVSFAVCSSYAMLSWNEVDQWLGEVDDLWIIVWK